jgi:hypothetical protein
VTDAPEVDETQAPQAGAPKLPDGMIPGMFQGVDKFEEALPQASREALAPIIHNSLDPNNQRQRIANQFYLSQKYNRPVSDIADSYELYRDDYARKAFGQESTDDAGFYTQAGTKIKKDADENRMIQGMYTPMYKAFTGETPVSHAAFMSSYLPELKKDPAYDPAHLDVYYQHGLDQWNQFQKFSGDHHDAIASVHDYLSLASTELAGDAQKLPDRSKLDPLRAQAVSALSSLPAQDQALIVSLAQRGAHAKEEEGIQKFSGRFARGLVNTVQGAADFVKEANPGNPLGLLSYVADAPERRADRLLKQAFQTGIDPMEAQGILGKAVLGTAESLPALAAAFTGPGLAVNFAASQNELQGHYEDQGIDPIKAAGLATAGAAVQTAVQFASTKLIVGKIPGLENWINSLSSKVAKIGVIGGLETGVLGAGVAVQKQSPDLIQNLAASFDGSIPKISSDPFWKQITDPVAALELLPLVLIGTGAAAMRHGAFGKEFISPERVKAAGYPAEVADKIESAPTVEAKEQILQDEFKSRKFGTVEQKSALQDVEAKQTPRNFLPDNHVRVTIERADGTTYEAAMNGYYEGLPGRGDVPSIGRYTEAGLSHGLLNADEKIVGPVPSAEEWASGIRQIHVVEPEAAKAATPEPEVVGPAGERNPEISTGDGVPTDFEQKMLADWKEQIRKEQDGTFTVSDENGKPVAQLATPEMAAKAAHDQAKGIISGSEAENWADKIIKERGYGSGTANTLDPVLFSAYAVKGAALIERGVTDFADWSKRMIRDHGQAIVPEIKDLWNSAQARLASFKASPPERGAWDDVKRILAPASRGPMAQDAAGSLREHGADLAMRSDRATAALEQAHNDFERLHVMDRLKAIDDIETGKKQSDPTLQPAADTMRTMLDTKRAEVQALGTGKLEAFIKDYFPHIWKDPEKAAGAFAQAAAKRPIEGSKSFLKERTIPTTAEGVALGLEPVSNNPIDLALLKMREMDKYILAQKWIQEMRGKGMTMFIRATEQPPTGWAKIDDRIATVYGNPTHPGAQQIEGYYYAPQEVAQVANNYLSPGLRGNKAFDAYLGIANGINQFQLGLSAFHLGFTSVDASISKLASGIEDLAMGKPIDAAKKVATVPLAPFTTFMDGSKVLKEWTRPGTQGAEIAAIVDGMKAAGGRARMDAFYQTNITKSMMEAFKEGQTLSGLWKLPFAALEQAARPIMEIVVPRQKMGVFADMARRELAKLPPDASRDQVREVMGKAWDSVDNRLGQMVYDNLFWNKTAKDLATASVRSVGWNLGTLREIGGGLKDYVQAGKDLSQKQSPEFTHRMAYVIALPVLTGFMGATAQYLMTGKGPEELKDYFFPKTGEKDPQGRDIRLTMPSYMKDIYHYGHDPVGTIEGKVHPAISLVWQMLNNKDFFGREIRHSDDSIIKQMMDEAKYFGNSIVPIGVKGFQQSTVAGQSGTERAANFVGVTRAAKWVSESAAEQLAGELAGKKFTSSKEFDQQLALDRGNIQFAMRNGTEEEKKAALASLEKLVQSEKLTHRQASLLLKGTDHTYLENALSHLDANEALRVFKQATPEERETISAAVLKKINAAHIPRVDKEAMRGEFTKLAPKSKPIP